MTFAKETVGKQFGFSPVVPVNHLQFLILKEARLSAQLCLQPNRKLWGQMGKSLPWELFRFPRCFRDIFQQPSAKGSSSRLHGVYERGERAFIMGKSSCCGVLGPLVPSAMSLVTLTRPTAGLGKVRTHTTVWFKGARVYGQLGSGHSKGVTGLGAGEEWRSL